MDIDVVGTTVTATIVGLQSRAPFEFAFYLMCGRERRAVKWYSDRPETVFEEVRAPGRYHVIGFARHPVSKEGGSRDSAEVQIGGGGYDPSAWKLPIREHAGLCGFLEARSLADGIHRIDGDHGATLDFLASGLQARGAARAILVCLTAANSRTSKTAPIFSGASISRQAGMPLFAVADPMVSAHDDLGLAWYAGGEGWGRLPRRLATVLDHVSRLVELPLILFGGSGGGFAALCIQRHLTVPASVCVWNPQTSITRYHPAAVTAYARHASPEVVGKVASPSMSRIAHALEQAGVEHDLTRAPLGGDGPIIYLQNAGDDFHVTNHLLPFAQAQGVSNPVLGVTTWVPGRRCFGLAAWGKGHIRPPTPMIVDLLLGLEKGLPVEGVVHTAFDRHLSQPIGPPRA